MSLLEGCKGLERFRTSGPYRAIVATFKYLLTSGIFVSLRGSGIVSGGHESFSNLGTLPMCVMLIQVDRVVNGRDCVLSGGYSR